MKITVNSAGECSATRIGAAPLGDMSISSYGLERWGFLLTERGRQVLAPAGPSTTTVELPPTDTTATPPRTMPPDISSRGPWRPAPSPHRKVGAAVWKTGMRLMTFACWLTGALVGFCGAGICKAVPPEPMKDFFRFDYPAPLPPRAGADAAASFFLRGAESTGDAGWLVCWYEQAGGRAAGRLRVRLLPPVFDNDPPEDDGYWHGGPPAFTLTSNTSPALPLAAVAGGMGGGWVIWTADGWVRAQWMDQARGGPEGPELPLLQTTSYEPFAAYVAQEGEHAWVALAFSGGIQGMVLERSGLETRIRARFSVPEVISAFMTAGHGRALLTAGSYPQLQPDAVRTAVVDADGVVSPVLTLPLPDGAAWLGALPEGDGFFGYWTQSFGQFLPDLLFGRSMTGNGEWRAGSAATVISGLPKSNDGWRLVPGPSHGVLWTPGGLSYSVKPGETPLLLGSSGDTGWNLHALDAGGRALSIKVTGSLFPENRGIIARRVDVPYQRSPHYAVMTPGTGVQQSPALAWTRRGPQVVFQVDRYFPNNAAGAPVIAGFNKQANAAPGVGIAVSDPAFSSPAQAWLGENMQLVAYRRENLSLPYPASTADPDDVVGRFYARHAAGNLSPSGDVFVIGGGPGSQRGVALATYNDGFLAAWREETSATGAEPATYSIRAAAVSRTGQVTPPGGRLFDLSLNEVSSVAVANNGYLTWKAVPTLVPPAFAVIRGTYFGFPFLRTLSPVDHDARAPQALRLGQGTIVAWRDRTSRAIHAGTVEGGPAAVRQVSPPGQRAREPAVAALDSNTAAVFWLGENTPAAGLSPYYPPGVWMAIVDADGVSRAVPVLGGDFDPDTLATSGDGAGRIALAVVALGFNSPGVKVVMLAPLVPANGGLAIAQDALAATVSWQVSAVFPSGIGPLETSTDLKQWRPSLPGAGPILSTGRTAWSFPIASGEPRRYFRLRGALQSAVE